MRQFQDRLGRSAVELLTDIRMSLVVNGLKEPAMTVKVVAGSIGYRSVSVLRRVFTDRMGMTAGQWRRLAREREWRRFVCGIPHE